MDIFTDWNPGDPPVPAAKIAGTLRYLRQRCDDLFTSAGSDPITAVTQPAGPGTVHMAWKSGRTADLVLNPAPFNPRGVRVAGLDYDKFDTFTVDGSLYLVLVDHVAAASLQTDVGANRVQLLARAGLDAVVIRGAYNADQPYVARDVVTYTDGIAYQTFEDLPVGTAPGDVLTSGGYTRPGWYPITTTSSDTLRAWTDGKPGAGKTVLRVLFERVLTLPKVCAGSYARLGTAAAAATTFSIRRNGTEVGTVAFAAGATAGTFTAAAATAFGPGDMLTVVAPASQDASAADLALALVVTGL